MPRKAPSDWLDEEIRAIPAGFPPYNRSKNPPSTKFLAASRQGETAVHRSAQHRHPTTRAQLTLGRKSQVPRYSSKAHDLSDVVLLERTMRAWGVDPDKNQVHRNFWMRKKVALNTRPEKNQSIIAVKLPDSFDEAALAVLIQEIQLLCKGSVLTEVIDGLNDENVSFFQPYYFNVINRRYERREGFERFLSKALDRLVRFTSFSGPAFERLEIDWSEGNGYNAVIFRALVGQHACYSNRCVSCGSDSKLCWNVSTEHYPHWTRLVCTSCQSVYAIKTVASFESLVAKRLRGQVDGCGFINAYYGIQQDLVVHYRAKQFVALVCIEDTT
jgi:hypothetical protein